MIPYTKQNNANNTYQVERYRCSPNHTKQHYFNWGVGRRPPRLYTRAMYRPFIFLCYGLGPSTSNGRRGCKPLPSFAGAVLRLNPLSGVQTETPYYRNKLTHGDTWVLWEETTYSRVTPRNQPGMTIICTRKVVVSLLTQFHRHRLEMGGKPASEQFWTIAVHMIAAYSCTRYMVFYIICVYRVQQ